MRALLSLPDLPDTPWNQWEDEVHHSFTGDRHFWEHPAISPLARRTRLERYWSMDRDSDDFLDQVASYWSGDIITRSDEFSRHLVDTAIRFRDAGDAATDAMGSFRVLVHDDDTTIDPEESNRHLHEAFEKSRVAREERVTALIGLCRVIIDENYRYGTGRLLARLNDDLGSTIITHRDHNTDQKQDPECYDHDLKNITANREDILANLGSVPQLKSFLYTAEQYGCPWASEDIYILSVIAHPGENLSHYVHDQLLFMNFLQDTVHHHQEDEVEVLLSGVLVGTDREKLLNGFNRVIDRIKYWWT